MDEQLSLFRYDDPLIEQMEDRCREFFSTFNPAVKPGKCTYEVWTHCPDGGKRFDYSVALKEPMWKDFMSMEPSTTPLLAYLRAMAEPRGMQVDIYITPTTIAVYGLWKGKSQGIRGSRNGD